MTTIAFALCTVSACAPEQAYDESYVLDVVETLSANKFEGRKIGTNGGKAARVFLLAEISKLKAFSSVQEHAFSFERKVDEATTIEGVNIVGEINGATPGKGPLLIITAHYDHMGIHKNEIYNGADDNASGVGALFAITQSFARIPPQHDVRIIWLDGEESGLRGARAYVKAAEGFDSRPVLNLNMDMISQNTNNEIYMAGAYHTPALKPLIEQAATQTDISVKFGHDRPTDGHDDWTLQSDQGAFHRQGIPFVYFGVEDHKHYHRPTDTFENIPLAFYKQSVKMMVDTARILDDNLDALAKSVE